MNITLHQLNVLSAVQKHGSITAAAHTLHITQPAVSNIIKQLERQFDYALTETIGKQICLTKAGERLVAASTVINNELEQAYSEISALHNKYSGTIDVAIVSTAKYFVPKLLGEFRHQHPGVKVKLTVCNRKSAIELLKDNTCDFLIMSQPPDEMPITKQLFYQDELVLVSSPEFSHKISRQDKRHSLKSLAECDWIIREPGSGTRIVMLKCFKKHGMQPNIVMEVSNNDSIKQLIMADMGISIVSKQSIYLELQHKLIKILPVTGFPMKHPWYLVTNKGKHISPVCQAFFDFIKQ